MDAVSEFLVIYLDSIDERLLDYLDEDDELRPEVVKRLHYLRQRPPGRLHHPDGGGRGLGRLVRPDPGLRRRLRPRGDRGARRGGTAHERRGGGGHRAHRGGPRPTWWPSKPSSTPTPRCAWASSSLGGERPLHGVGQVGVGEVQVPGRGGDVGVAEKALDDVDVHAAAQQARGVGVAPAVGKVAPGDPRPRAGAAGPAWPPSSGRSVPRSARRVAPRG